MTAPHAAPREGSEPGRVRVDALMNRLNARLKKRGQVLRKTRAADDPRGTFYLVDRDRGWTITEHVDAVALARELDALAPGEVAVDRDGRRL